MDENNVNSTEQPVNTPPAVKRIADNSGKNAMIIWGALILAIGGIIGLTISYNSMLAGNATWVIGLSITISSVVLGLILLGIGAIVDRLNTIINLLKENKQD